ncbi:hypothetical protein [Elioraea sp.]|jgi:hypothetical protein|uniref:hypothetical protein n=1 Tax=Elioraea sp. TaxID=2185103 RepID=UPI0021DF093C|nr:hypothetical protein [Elioraea sp.]GIX09374.1 MAG: hypothetical protein KatS3mg116_1084 [Elioraea sp.]
MPRRLALAAALALLALPAAAETACWIDYAEFENTVPHLDVGACPGGAPTPERGFCRLGIVGDAVTVYTFEFKEGSPCLTRAQRLSLPEFLDRFGATYRKP